jgi:putative transposase
MIDRSHDLPITKQAKALNIGRGSVYYLPRPVPDADLAIMPRLDPRWRAGCASVWSRL